MPDMVTRLFIWPSLMGFQSHNPIGYCTCVHENGIQTQLQCLAPHPIDPFQYAKMFLTSLIFILVANLCVDSSHFQTIENETGLADLYTTEAFSRLTNPKIYNKFVLPNQGSKLFFRFCLSPRLFHSPGPINVNVSLFMLDYGSIDEQKVVSFLGNLFIFAQKMARNFL